MRVAYYYIAPLAAATLASALPTDRSSSSSLQPNTHIRLPRQTVLNDGINPTITIPDVPPGTELATDPLTGYKAWISSGLTSTIQGIQWLTEVFAVFRGDRDEGKAPAPAPAVAPV